MADTMMAEVKITPADQVRQALREKGYRSLSVHFLNDKRSTINGFILYTNGKHVLVLQEYKDGGCELYRTVSDSLGIQDTIDKIPVVEVA
jgi:hypothetical protein